MEHLPAPGRYSAKPTTNFGFIQTKSGKTMWTAELEITSEGPDRGKLVEYSRTLDDLTGDAIGYFESALRALGDFQDDLEAFVPTNTVQIVVEHSEYNGKVRARVKYINGRRGSAKADPTLIADLKRKFKALRGEATPEPAVSPYDAPSGAYDF